MPLARVAAHNPPHLSQRAPLCNTQRVVCPCGLLTAESTNLVGTQRVKTESVKDLTDEMETVKKANKIIT